MSDPGKEFESENSAPESVHPISKISTIEDILDKLAAPKNSKDSLENSRKSLLEQLKNSFRDYFGYSDDLASFLITLFSPMECFNFIQKCEKPLPVTIRSNSLKVKRRDLAQSLIARGVNLDPVGDWSSFGLRIIESSVPIGATPEYLAGHYMLQSASSFVPVISLGVKRNERIIDMCAAPGGKTTHIAALMENTGSLIANDVNKDRAKALIANIHRMGVENCIVTNYDAKELKIHFSNIDRVLLDAPCSGTGVISRDPSIKSKRSIIDIRKCAHTQKELILCAIDLLNSNGVLVYSTCSIAVEENEEVINYAMKKRFVKIEPLGIDESVGRNGFTSFGPKHFHPHLKRTRRIYPHTDEMDGFFVAKMVKYKNGEKLVNGTSDGIGKSDGRKRKFEISDGNKYKK